MNLRFKLAYEPRELQFGTSGRRGEVVHLTQLEVYINALAEVEYLQSLPAAEGGIQRGDFYFAYDLRPSSRRICQAVERAIRDAGMRPVNAGALPTPALTAYAIGKGAGSIMVTGSHIPFDRNGYKVNTSKGELLKQHEEPVNLAVAGVRERVYQSDFNESPFDERGLFKTGDRDLSAEIPGARAAYIDRYVSFFEGCSLKGARLLVYQHSAVGRDLLVEILQRFGAEVIPRGRSETFVPIDTENIDAEQLAVIQALADQETNLFAVVSMDGDSDRPLILDAAGPQVRFFGGDLVGMIVADYLGADAVVVPISCNDGIDRGRLASVLEPKTRIGSPYVIAGMELARQCGKHSVCGWEANGGFLTGSEFRRAGRTLPALPTRDAILPILATLFAARERNISLAELFAGLPKRFSRAALLRNYPKSTSRKVVERFSPPHDVEGIKQELDDILTAEKGFGRVTGLDYTDGVRATCANGDVVHFRPSGNADEFRIYAVADTQARADEIAALGVAEPGGILRMLETRIAP